VGATERENLYQTVLNFEIYCYNCSVPWRPKLETLISLNVISNEAIESELCMAKERRFQNDKRNAQVCFTSNDPYAQ
jgi:hypothetical protein